MIVRLLALALALALLPASAGAHGEHGGAAPLGAVVTLGGYQIELLSHPAPPARGQAGHVIAKVLRSDGLDPATGGEV
ncbi:MAG: hypothetical protein HYV94_14630, partial [Candidatus Rokubacteria bacterium]|nr:hypothetical protein [Candidatus Rokubacteria bacterium]